MKILSHESLKKQLIKDLDMFKKRCYTKQYIIQLYEAYGAKATMKEKRTAVCKAAGFNNKIK